jgi:hypothetical protein
VTLEYAHGADHIGLSGVLRCHLLQQRLRLLQIARVEPLSEPALDRSKQFATEASFRFS